MTNKTTMPEPVKEETVDLGIPKSCGKPFCAPNDHHPLCDKAEPVKVPSDLQADMAALFEENRHAFGRTFEKEALALLARYGQPVEPEGWQLVPKEPTQYMFDVFEHLCRETNAGEPPFYLFERLYLEMLEASPKFKGGNDGSF